jgi:predicted PurR-regulated permease PerM
LLALIVAWSVLIIAPFIGVLLWAVIIAVSVYPAFLWLSKRVGNRNGLAAACIVVLLLLLIVGPIAGSLPGFAESVRAIVADVQDGTLAVPPASERVRDWPVIGEPLHLVWTEAHSNITVVLERFRPQLQDAGVFALGSLAGAGLAVLQFIISIIIAGVILSHHQRIVAIANRLVARIAPESQTRFLKLTEHTVRGVTTGVIGVAFIQAILAGIGFAVIGVPAAAVWAALCLFLAIVQISIGIVVIPVAVYVFANHELLPFILFLAWNIPILAIDNVLKPLLMGRGVDAPMLIIFLGAIGGFISFGFLGLFFGAVVLVIANDILLSWLDEQDVDNTELAGNPKEPIPD